MEEHPSVDEIMHFCNDIFNMSSSSNQTDSTRVAVEPIARPFLSSKIFHDSSSSSRVPLSVDIPLTDSLGEQQSQNFFDSAVARRDSTSSSHTQVSTASYEDDFDITDLLSNEDQNIVTDMDTHAMDERFVEAILRDIASNSTSKQPIASSTNSLCEHQGTGTVSKSTYFTLNTESPSTSVRSAILDLANCNSNIKFFPVSSPANILDNGISKNTDIKFPVAYTSSDTLENYDEIDGETSKLNELRTSRNEYSQSFLPCANNFDYYLR